MPETSGYVKFEKGNWWCGIGFTGPEEWEYPRTNHVNIVQDGNGRVALMTYINGEQYLTEYFPLQREIPYFFKISYSGGSAYAEINGHVFESLPAPTVDLPFNILHAQYHVNWWDVPEHQRIAIVTGTVVTVIGAVAAFFGLKKFRK